jgi:flagellin
MPKKQACFDAGTGFAQGTSHGTAAVPLGANTMALSIQNNIASIDAQRNLAATQSRLNSSLSKLSSGYRITTAGDDAAGLAISEKLRSQINGLNQAGRNANDGISMIQTAEGALQQTSAMLQRMRELAVQASNDTLSTSDRASINTEVQQLRTEINDISTQTKFNGLALLTGALTTQQDAATSTAIVGDVLNTNGNATISSIDTSAAAAGETFTFAAGPNAGDIVLTRASDNVSQTINVAAIGAHGAVTLDFGKIGVKLSLQSDVGGKAAADTVTDLTGKTITTLSAGGAANIQVGANASDYMNVGFSQVDISASGMSSLNTALAAFNTTQNATTAQALITAVDSGIDQVNGAAASLGAYQNRLQQVISNLATTSQNLSSSESSIRDVDVAAETARMTKSNILMQAGISVLSQANQVPQMALKLLGG